tara:strand:+ start:321 stop:554 length:234 start_codon:yes stop_codon:yes gene_type:complete
MVKKGLKCKICGYKLRTFTKSHDWQERCYHIKCFNEMVDDIHNFNSRAYTKYDYEPIVCGMPLSEAKKAKEFVITFD